MMDTNIELKQNCSARAVSICLIAIFLMFSTGAFAEIYKWTDDSGTVHFSDQPGVTKGDIEVLEKQKFPKRAPGSEAIESEVSQTKKESLGGSSFQSAKTQRLDNCKTSKDRVKQLSVEGKIYRLDERGGRIYLSEDEKQSELEAAHEEVKFWCH